MAILWAFGSAFAVAAGFLVISTGAHAQSPQGAPLFAVLNGANECNNVAPPDGPDCRKGDLNGIGSATITFPNATTVCWGITVANLAGATLAHIHQGVPGINGPIVVDLTPPVEPSNANPGASSGCVADTAATIAAIRADPTKYYVNIHNGAFGSGAVRGQLH